MGNRKSKLTNKEITSELYETKIFIKNLTRLFQDYVIFKGDIDKFSKHIQNINKKREK